jgi:hypothetical protein
MAEILKEELKIIDADNAEPFCISEVPIDTKSEYIRREEVCIVFIWSTARELSSLFLVACSKLDHRLLTASIRYFTG